MKHVIFNTNLFDCYWCCICFRSSPIDDKEIKNEDVEDKPAVNNDNKDDSKKEVKENGTAEAKEEKVETENKADSKENTKDEDSKDNLKVETKEKDTTESKPEKSENKKDDTKVEEGSDKKVTDKNDSEAEKDSKESSKPPFRPFLPDDSAKAAEAKEEKKDGATTNSSPNKVSPRPTPPSTPPVRNDKHYPLKKRGLESPIPFAAPAIATAENDAKKAKLDNEPSTVTEAVTDPAVTVSGNGKGADNNSPNPMLVGGIVGEEITDSFVFSGRIILYYFVHYVSLCFKEKEYHLNLIIHCRNLLFRL